ncbi:MAG: hypothetical protein VYC39_13805 [Myxococcota bacterium]|nr:hypothetical protein [Myxococcota bacterium]
MVLAVQKLSSICCDLDKVTLELVSNNGESVGNIEQQLDEIEEVFNNEVAGNLLYIGVRIKSLRNLLENSKGKKAQDEAENL